MKDNVRFYFSFRSPYSWLGTYRLQNIIKELPVSFELIPVFPPKDFKNDPEAIPNKVKYIGGDIKRIASAYGLTVNWPKVFDTNWIRPHAAFYSAQDQGKGLAFSLAMHKARFCDGQDLGDIHVIKNIAKELDLDSQAVAEAADNRSFHKRIIKGLAIADKDHIFGVPTFKYKDQTYWGNDRIDWLIRDINRDNEKSIPDLITDPFQRPF